MRHWAGRKEVEVEEEEEKVQDKKGGNGREEGGQT